MDSLFESFESEEMLCPDKMDPSHRAVLSLADCDPLSRENALKYLISALRSGHAACIFSITDEFEVTLITKLAEMLNMPASTQEGKLILKLVKLLALAVGSDEDNFYSVFSEKLKILINNKDHQWEEELRRYALFTKTFISFVCSSEPNTSLWDFCEHILTCHTSLTTHSNAFKITAVECWLLMATKMANDDIVHRSRGGVFDALLSLLVATHQQEKDETQHSSNPSQFTVSNLKMQRILALAFAFLFEVSQTDPGKLQHSDKLQQVGALLSDLAEQHGEVFALARDRVVGGKGIGDTENTAPSFASVVVLAALRRVLGGRGLRTAQKCYPVVSELLHTDEGCEVSEEVMEVWGRTMEMQTSGRGSGGGIGGDIGGGIGIAQGEGDEEHEQSSSEYKRG